ncbi:MAG: 2TM domain-containing protein [Candidatus Hydrogenedentota bacterium]
MSDPGDKRYTEEEVSRLIKRALQGESHSDTISHEELMDIADKSGVTPSAMRAILDDEENSYELEDAKRRWLKRHHEDFHNHLRSYVIVNGALICMNLMSTGFRGYFWALWPIMGWGIGLLFHASDTYFVSEERIERGARTLLRRRRHIEGASKWMNDTGKQVKKQKWYGEMESALDKDRDRY